VPLWVELKDISMLLADYQEC